ENFGRRKSDLAGKALEQVLREQVTRLKAIADDLCIPLTHLKPHGALYNMAACDEGLSANVINVLQSVLPDARLVGPPASQTQILADRLGIPFVAEGFADRAYEADGQLRDRQKPGAVLSSGDLQAQQALDLATRQRVTTYAGDQITLLVDSICVHGDTPGAFASACQIKASFLDYGLSICAPA
ncbi:MAG: LamB/YcsF family protein, partial [Pseudomonadota bacterium]